MWKLLSQWIIECVSPDTFHVIMGCMPKKKCDLEMYESQISELEHSSIEI